MKNNVFYNTTARYDLSHNQVPRFYIADERIDILIAELFLMLRLDLEREHFEERDISLFPIPSVKKETVQGMIDKLIDRGIVKKEILEVSHQMFQDSDIGSIGRQQRDDLRAWPNPVSSVTVPEIRRTIDQIPADIITPLKAAYAELPDHVKQGSSEDDWIIFNYYSVCDQFNEMLVGLKNKEFDHPYIVTFVNPEFFPVPGYTPDENILLNKASRYPNELMFTIDIEDDRRLVMSLMVREQYAGTDVDYIAFKYSVLLQLIAHFTGLTAECLYVNAIKTKLLRSSIKTEEFDVINGLDYLSRTSQEGGMLYKTTTSRISTVRINPDVKDFYKLKLKDVIIEEPKQDPEETQPQGEAK